uniref:Two-component system sensor kinase n=1 Tax=Parastrongyloides trichosuri TaxID=131310 RepID=A0A0N4Z2V8_PARTI
MRPRKRRSRRPVGRPAGRRLRRSEGRTDRRHGDRASVAGRRAEGPADLDRGAPDWQGPADVRRPAFPADRPARAPRFAGPLSGGDADRQSARHDAEGAGRAGGGRSGAGRGHAGDGQAADRLWAEGQAGALRRPRLGPRRRDRRRTAEGGRGGGPGVGRGHAPGVRPRLCGGARGGGRGPAGPSGARPVQPAGRPVHRRPARRPGPVRRLPAAQVGGAPHGAGGIAHRPPDAGACRRPAAERRPAELRPSGQHGRHRRGRAAARPVGGAGHLLSGRGAPGGAERGAGRLSRPRPVAGRDARGAGGAGPVQPGPAGAAVGADAPRPSGRIDAACGRPAGPADGAGQRATPHAQGRHPDGPARGGQRRVGHHLPDGPDRPGARPQAVGLRLPHPGAGGRPPVLPRPSGDGAARAGRPRRLRPRAAAGPGRGRGRHPDAPGSAVRHGLHHRHPSAGAGASQDPGGQ